MASETTTVERVDMRADDRPSVEAGGRSALQKVVLGLKSGLIATVAMTVFRMPISHSPPPTATFWAKYVAGGEPEDHVLIGLILHLAYGMGGGLLFAVLSPVHTSGPEVEDEKRGVLTGLAFALLLSAFGVRVLLEGLLGTDPDPDERFIFHVGHVIYGLTLGAWYGSADDEA